MNPMVLLLVAIAAEVMATSALKASEGFTRPVPATLVVVGYGLAFYLLSITLKSIDVGVAYAIWSGLGIVGVTAIGSIVYQQAIGPAHLVGMGLIIAGVVVLNLFAAGPAH